ESCLALPEGGTEARPSDRDGRIALAFGELWTARAELELSNDIVEIPRKLARIAETAKELGHAALVAESELAWGLAAAERDELLEAERLLSQAAGDAKAARESEIAWEAALALIDLDGVRLLRPAEPWVRLAEETTPAGDPLARLRVVLASARALRAQGRLAF